MDLTIIGENPFPWKGFVVVYVQALSIALPLSQLIGYYVKVLYMYMEKYRCGSPR